MANKQRVQLVSSEVINEEGGVLESVHVGRQRMGRKEWSRVERTLSTYMEEL